MKGLCQSQSSVCHAPRLAGQNSRLRHQAEVCFPACLRYPSTLYLSSDWRRVWGFQLFECVGPARSTKIEAFRDKIKKNKMSKCSVYWNFNSQKCTSKLKPGTQLMTCAPIRRISSIGNFLTLNNTLCLIGCSFGWGRKCLVVCRVKELDLFLKTRQMIWQPLVSPSYKAEIII